MRGARPFAPCHGRVHAGLGRQAGARLRLQHQHGARAVVRIDAAARGLFHAQHHLRHVGRALHGDLGIGCLRLEIEAVQGGGIADGLAHDPFQAGVGQRFAHADAGGGDETHGFAGQLRQLRQRVFLRLARIRHVVGRLVGARFGQALVRLRTDRLRHAALDHVEQALVLGQSLFGRAHARRLAQRLGIGGDHAQREGQAFFLDGGAGRVDPAAGRIDAGVDAPAAPQRLLDAHHAARFLRTGGDFGRQAGEALPLRAIEVGARGRLRRTFALHGGMALQRLLQDLVEAPGGAALGLGERVDGCHGHGRQYGRDAWQ
ncbi:hypothetical protein D3C87_1072430 [compost metagenome]